MNLSKKIKNRRKLKSDCDIDITSLLDILVILLVFMLQNYSASELRLDLVESLSLPLSTSEDMGENAVIVQINRHQNIWVNNESIGSLQVQGDTIPILSEKLKEVRAFEEEKLERIAGAQEDAYKDSLKRINLILDEELPYSVMRQVMHTSALAGFPEFKFIVKGFE